MKKYYDTGAEGGGGNQPPPGPKRQKQSSIVRGLIDSTLSQEEQDNMRIAEQRFGEDAQAKIKDFRVKVDSFYLTAKKLQKSRESALAVTAFQSARQFLGIMLGEKGAAYPYKTMTEPGKVVGPRNDKGEVLEDILSVTGNLEGSEIKDQATIDEIERCRAFRAKAGDVITDFTVYMENTGYNSITEFVAQNDVLKNLLSGKMWLGEHMAVLSGAE